MRVNTLALNLDEPAGDCLSQGCLEVAAPHRATHSPRVFGVYVTIRDPRPVEDMGPGNVMVITFLRNLIVKL